MLVLSSLFFILRVWSSVASYDKTVILEDQYRFKMVNLNDVDIPIVDRSFLHFTIRCCKSLLLAFQVSWNITNGQSVILQMFPTKVLVMDCASNKQQDCISHPAKVFKMEILECNKPFLLRVDWNHEGWMKLSKGKAIDQKGKQLISRGGGPEVEELFSYKSGKHFPIGYISIGKFTRDRIQINITYATVLPYNASKSLYLRVVENTPIGSVIHKLSEFQPDENVSVSRSESDPGVIGVNGSFLTLAKELDYETKRKFYFQLRLQGDVLNLSLSILLHVQDISDKDNKIYLHRHPSILEELPVGTCMEDWVRIKDMNLKHRYTYRLLNNIYFWMNETTGELTLKRRIDRDGSHGVRRLQMKMKVSVPGGKKTVEYDIKVLDLNDNYPKFEKELYRIVIPFKKSGTNSRITDFKITDLDGDQRPGFDLSIQDEDKLDVFYLQNYTLYAYQDKLMDVQILRSRGWNYLITVKVTDRPRRGRPLSSYAFVLLVIEPTVTQLVTKETHPLTEFHKLSYISVPETSSKGHVVLRLKEHISVTSQAEDTIWQYSISSSVCLNDKAERDYFGINQYSGDVMVGSPLDADVKTGGCPVLELIFNTTNLSTGKSQNFAAVNITVVDTNDNPPIFHQKITRVNLPCDVLREVAYPVTALSVSDMESDDKLTLQLISSSLNRYNIVYNDSLWSLTMDTSRYNYIEEEGDAVKVIAVDAGVPRLTSTAVVFIRQNCTSSPDRVSVKSTEDNSSPLSSSPVVSDLEAVTVSSDSKAADVTTVKDGDVSQSVSYENANVETTTNDMVLTTDFLMCTTYKLYPKVTKSDQKNTTRHHAIPRSTSTEYSSVVSSTQVSTLLGEDQYDNLVESNLPEKEKESILGADRNEIHLPDQAEARPSEGESTETMKTAQDTTTVACCECTGQNEYRDVTDKMSTSGNNCDDNNVYIILLIFLILIVLILVVIFCMKHHCQRRHEGSSDEG